MFDEYQVQEHHGAGVNLHWRATLLPRGSEERKVCQTGYLHILQRANIFGGGGMSNPNPQGEL